MNGDQSDTELLTRALEDADRRAAAQAMPIQRGYRRGRKPVADISPDQTVLFDSDTDHVVTS